VPAEREAATLSETKASAAEHSRRKLVVGLGNPGIEYQFTWHNLGFLTVDRLADRHGARIENRRSRSLTGKCRLRKQEVLLAKPETYMNLSGLAVRELVQELEADPAKDLVVVYDELDLPQGIIRVRERGSAGGHHGMESIIGALGMLEFPRIRLGIHPGREVGDGAKYVLSQIKKSQLEAVDEQIDRAADAVEAIFEEGIAAAMNRFNRKASGEAAAE
jgi:PTH1 family peptidyl-tRNA hydrolase